MSEDQRRKEDAETTDSVPPPASGPEPTLFPEEIAGYRILGILGEGGMGVVYRAEQSRPRREVALKVLRPGRGSPATLRRFELEAEVLGHLDHPGIAQVLEAGTTDLGSGPQPYFAMELVRGRSLTEHAEAESYQLRARLSLFVRACEAVEHAHQKGVIHRDLKPANVLVDELGQPRVLDFGVARVTNSDLKAATLKTELGQLIGTLAYMSPEQLSGDPAALDTRSDVYSLGIIAHELLGRRPVHDLSGKSVAESVRMLSSREPPMLGTVDTTLRGDLETIVAKALMREKERRYPSASALAADFQAFLANEPISARPPSAAYQLSKFARRHRGLFAGACAALLALIAGFGLMALGFARANTERRRAEEESQRAREATSEATLARDEAVASREEAEAARERAEAINRFLVHDIMGAAAPIITQGREYSITDALDAAATGIDHAFERHPLVKLHVQDTIGRLYTELGRNDEAATHLDAALDLARQHDRIETPDGLSVRRNRSLLHQQAGELDEALAQAEENAELARRLHGEGSVEVGHVLMDIASVRAARDDNAEAEETLRSALEILEGELGPDADATLLARQSLATVIQSQGRLEEARPVLEDVVARRTAVDGERHPETLRAMHNLGINLTEADEHEQAESLLQRTLDLRQRVLGEAHPHALTTRRALAHVYLESKRPEEAEPVIRRTLELQEATLGTSHHGTLSSRNQLAFVLDDLKRDEEAEALYRSLLDEWLALRGPTDQRTLGTRNNLGMFLLERGRPDEALEHLSVLVEDSVTGLSDSHVYTAVFRSNLGLALRQAGRFPEAEEELLRSHATFVSTVGAAHARALNVLSRLEKLYEESDQPEKLAGIRAQLADAKKED